MDENFIPQNILKLLQDKNNDKRQQGCQQLKSLVCTFAQNGREQQIKQIIEQFKLRFINTSQLFLKKSGIVALQTVAEVLVKEYPQLAERVVKDLTLPVLECLSDKEDKARFAAVECLTTLCKIMKTMILINFNEIFEHQLGRSAEQESQIVQAMLLLDTQLKAQVQLAVQEKLADPSKPCYFNMNSFMLLMQNKLKTRNTQVRTFLLGWIKTLNQCHNNDLYIYFPMILEGLFMMLGESNKDVRNGADAQANEFLKQVELKVNYDQKINEQIIEILLKICQIKGNQNNYAKLNSLLWIFEYLRVFQVELEEELKGRNAFQHSQSIIKPEEYLRSNTSPIIKNQIQFQFIGNESPLRKTILNSLSQILGPILTLLSNEEEEIRKAALKTNEVLLKIMERTKNQSVEFMKIIPTIKEILTDKKSNTAESALIWMKHLLENYSENLFPLIEDILTKLIDKLADSETTIVQNIMDVLTSISSHNQYFEIMIDKILTMLHKGQEIMEKKGEQIFKKLCSQLNSQKVYFTITAKLLESYSDNDVLFISNIVQTLTTLLIQEKELQSLRNILRNLKHEKDEKKRQNNQEIFETLYRTFCYNSMSVITLCLLSEEYELAYNIIISFSEVEVNQYILCEIAQLINVLESPVFVFLRLQLLEYDSHPFLMKCLFGLMMLLPQGNAYKLLKQRLKNISTAQSQNLQQEKFIEIEFLDIQKLLSQFRDIRQQCINQDAKEKKDCIFEKI